MLLKVFYCCKYCFTNTIPNPVPFQALTFCIQSHKSSYQTSFRFTNFSHKFNCTFLQSKSFPFWAASKMSFPSSFTLFSNPRRNPEIFIVWVLPFLFSSRWNVSHSSSQMQNSKTGRLFVCRRRSIRATTKEANKK
jgi:hypothetical protein